MYNLDGSQVAETIPPENFDPLDASAQELRTYNFPPRPHNPARLTAWAKLKPGQPGMCVGHKVNLPATRGPNQTSRNWAGGISFSTNLKTSETEWGQAAFVTSANCGGTQNSGYSTWSGLGGWNTSDLMQSGTDVAGVAVNDIYMWWEMLDATHPNPEVIFLNSSSNSGDDVDAKTVWDGQNVTFYVTDYTIEQYYSTSAIGSYMGDVSSKYYDGSSSEAITEAPAGGPTADHLYYLRKPTTANTQFIGTYPNNNEPTSYTSDNIREVNSAGSVLQTSGFLAAQGGWYDYWQSCG